MTKDAALTDRAKEAGAQAGLGTWLLTTRVNSRRESDLLVPGVILIVVVVVGGYFILTTNAMPLIGKIVMAAMGLAFLAVGYLMASLGWAYLRAGRWLVHQYEHGFVLERTKGPVRTVRHDVATGELFAYTEPGDATGASIDHIALRLTLDDGTAIAMDEPVHAYADALIQLGQRCGAGDPEPLEYLSAVKMLSEQSWQVGDAI